jgi:hypothetical protein
MAQPGAEPPRSRHHAPAPIVAVILIWRSSGSSALDSTPNCENG